MTCNKHNHEEFDDDNHIKKMQVTTLSQRLIDLSQLPPTHGATFLVHLNQIYLCMWNGADNLRLVTGMTSISRTDEQSKKIIIYGCSSSRH